MKKKVVLLNVVSGFLLFTNALVFASGYSDINSSSPFFSYINDLQSKGIDIGVGDGKFGPADLLTRAQFIHYLISSIGIKPSNHPVHFSDSIGNWAASDIQAAYENGLVKGTSDSTYDPDSLISREAAATIVWRYLSSRGDHPSVENFMLPNSVDTWAREGVVQCIAKHLFGQPFKSGNLKSAMDREEAAALLDLALKETPLTP